MEKSLITTHVLDTALGKPGSGIELNVASMVNNEWRQVGSGTTNDDGRVNDLVAPHIELTKTMYKLHFELRAYFERTQREVFYPYAEVVFYFDPGAGKVHIPLVLSNYSYATYRGS